VLGLLDQLEQQLPPGVSEHCERRRDSYWAGASLYNVDDNA
jgi:hypothetical protein